MPIFVEVGPAVVRAPSETWTLRAIAGCGACFTCPIKYIPRRGYVETKLMNNCLDITWYQVSKTEKKLDISREL